MIQIAIFSGLTCAACVLVADTGEKAPELANPAAVFCVDQGASYEIRTADSGDQTGVCILPDGTEVDAWEYFRSKQDTAK